MHVIMLLQSCLIFLVFFHSLMFKKGQKNPRYHIISYQVGSPILIVVLVIYTANPVKVVLPKA